MCHAHRAPNPRRAPAGRPAHARPVPPASFPRRPVRVGIYLALTGIVVLAVGLLLWPRGGTVAGPVDQRLTITMGGFSSPVVTTRAGTPLRLQLINPDSNMHSDGGGWHQLAIPALGVDARVAPRSDTLVEIPATAPGEYAFYCDLCCGGKENPSMQGRLRVTA
jgi:cytochrome c oxidase subunit II